jgi:hypothetical protein
MRYIDMVRLLRERDDWPPEGWLERIRKAQAELGKFPLDKKARTDIFVRYSTLWKEVKEQYRQISHEKCWYCESKTDRHRGDIDHYRPKGGVTGTRHPGYWWLAFEWRNWRFSCEMCNSKLTDLATDIVGGKGSDFPLEGGADGESRRVWDECACPNYDDLKKERPLLLDPTHPEDPGLITFRSDGRPRPNARDKTSIEYQRAEISINTYHLNHSALNRRRQTQIYYPLCELVEKIQKHKLTQKNADHSNITVQEAIEDNLTRLRRMIAQDAEYSSAARAYLKKYRHWDWVDRLLTAS